MSEVNLSFKHGRTLEEARARLGEAVSEISSRCAARVRRVEWSADRNKVHMAGHVFEMDAWVDPQEIHLVGNIPLLGQLLGGPVAATLKQILHHTFQKQLT